MHIYEVGNLHKNAAIVSATHQRMFAETIYAGKKFYPAVGSNHLIKVSPIILISAIKITLLIRMTNRTLKKHKMFQHIQLSCTAALTMVIMQAGHNLQLSLKFKHIYFSCTNHGNNASKT